MTTTVVVQVVVRRCAHHHGVDHYEELGGEYDCSYVEVVYCSATSGNAVEGTSDVIVGV